MMWNGYGMGGWGMAAMLVSSLFFWALLVGVGILLYRNAGAPTAAPSPAHLSAPTRSGLSKAAP